MNAFGGLTPEEFKLVQWAIDQVRELIKRVPAGTDLQKLADDFEAFQRWRQNISVAGAQYFENNMLGLSLVIPQPPSKSTQIDQTETVLVKVTSTLTGGGFYSGSLYGGGLTVSGSSNLSLPASSMSTISSGVLVLNTGESGASTHTVTANSWHVGKLVGGNSSGPIVAIDSASSLPTGTGKYKVLMLIDSLNPGTPGWDYPRFH